MATTISVSIPESNLKDLEQFKNISHFRRESVSSTMVQAMVSYIKHNPVESNNKITDYTVENFVEEPILRISPHTEFKQLRIMVNKMAKNDLVAFKEQAKKIISAVELEIESRVNR